MISLRVRAARGAGNLLILSVVARVVSLLAKIALARLLLPEDFGIFTAAVLISAFLTQLTGVGVDTAMIQRSLTSPIHQKVAFTLRLIPAILAFAILIIITPLLAALLPDFFIGPYTWMVALTLIVNSFAYVPTILISARLEYQKLVLPSIAGAIFNSIVAVALASLAFGPWSLAIGYLLGATATAVMLHARMKPVLGFHLDRQVSKQLLVFAIPSIGVSLASFSLAYLDTTLAAWLLGINGLGLYYMAKSWGTIPDVQLVAPSVSALFPAFTSVKDDKPRFLRGLQDSIATASILSIPAGVGIFVLAPLFVPVFLGERWTPTVVPLQFLALFGAVKSVGRLGNPALLALGRPGIIAKVQVLELGLQALFLVPLGLTFGLSGLAFGVLAASVVALWYQLTILSHLVDATSLDLIRNLRFVLLSSIFMAVVVWGAMSGLALPQSFAYLTILLLLGAGVYILCLRVFDHKLVKSTSAILRGAIRIRE